MFNSKKNVFALILIASFVLFLASSLFIQAAEEEPERELEIKYPIIDQWRPETVEQAILPQYIKYIFTFAVGIAGLVAFGSLIYGGFRYITSAGAPTVQTEAKDQIFAGVIGLVILLSSYLILTTINPQLVLLQLEELIPIVVPEAPGVYLSTKSPFPGEEEIKNREAQVVPLFYSSADLGGFVEDEIKSMKIINPVGFYYGVILHKKINYGGDCTRTSSLREESMSLSLAFSPASITLFQEVKESKGQVKICNTPEVIGTEEEEEYCEQLSKQTNPEFKSLPGKVDKNVWQVEVPKGWLLVLRGAEAGICEVFDKSEANLKGHPMNRCKPAWAWAVPWGWWIWESCATDYALFPTK